MFERFFQFNPEEPGPEDLSSQKLTPHEQDSGLHAARRLRFESGHAMPAPMFIRLKEDPPRDK